MADANAVVYLKNGEERRLRAGHLWVYSNEVDTGRSPLRQFEPGQPVRVHDHRDRFIGHGYINPHSLICARLVSRHPQYGLDRPLLVHRLNIARALRERHFGTPHYRLVHGEGDGLPGLIVDRFGDTCVVQLNTAGMEQVRDSVVEAVQQAVSARHILLRCDSPIRELEGLDRYTEWAGAPGPAILPVTENELHFTAPATTGQKTGWYYDHAANRRALAPFVRGRRVLDLFSYCGAWGITAAAAGADTVLAVDRSAESLEFARDNAERNGVAERFETRTGDAIETLAALREADERFDTVIVDPPAFIKRRRDYKAGLSGYWNLNRAAFQVLKRDGHLISASCSALLNEEDFRQTLNAAARHVERTLGVVMRGEQGPDHPVHAAIPETRYLKTLFLRALPARDMP